MTQRPTKFRYTFAVAWLIPKENSSYCMCAKLSSSLKYIKVRKALCLLICFIVLSYSSFRSRSERPHALQLLIKLLIRLFLMWEGLVLLYRKFLFKMTHFVFSGTIECYELEDYIGEILNNEFDTIVEDGSLPKVRKLWEETFSKNGSYCISSAKQINPITGKSSACQNESFNQVSGK